MTIENEAAVEAEGTPVSENTESSVTDAEVETPEGEEAQADEESTTSESDEEEKPKKKGGFQRRIDELTRKNYEAQREAEAYKSQLAQYQQQVQQQQMQNDAVPPKLADYNYDETAYYQAVQDWNESQIKRGSSPRVRGTRRDRCPPP
jgi:predicted RNase H-like nuclease (RuvC/YqgF family)